MTVKASDLAFVHIDGKWRLEEGDFDVQIGTEMLTVKCTATKIWDTPNR